MYVGLIACCPVVSYGECAEGTDGQTDGQTDERQLEKGTRQTHSYVAGEYEVLGYLLNGDTAGDLD